jgi:predicted transcriptional regulator
MRNQVERPPVRWVAATFNDNLERSTMTSPMPSSKAALAGRLNVQSFAFPKPLADVLAERGRRALRVHIKGDLAKGLAELADAVTRAAQKEARA